MCLWGDVLSDKTCQSSCAGRFELLVLHMLYRDTIVAEELSQLSLRQEETLIQFHLKSSFVTYNIVDQQRSGLIR